MCWETVKDNGISLGFPAGGTDTLRVVFDTKGADIAYVVDDRGLGNRNASLIAAAPDLFKACRLLWDAVMDCSATVPDRVLVAAFDCKRASVKAVSGRTFDADAVDWVTRHRREQGRIRQQRFRAKRKAEKEATHGR